MNAINNGRMPVLFIGHGSPMNAIERNEFHLGWQKIAHRISKPKSILCVSAHWETHGLYVTVTKQPETIHDFYGFPKALFDVQYPAPGEPRLARLTAELLMAESVGLDPERGLDHGAWSVLIAMYPQANIPVVQLSLDTTRLGSFHYNIAKKLAPLRDEGVLIVASGNIVHNLPLFNYHDPTPLDWAVDFDNDIKRRIAARDHEALISRDSLGPSTNLAIPTPEHYLPLLYAIALQDKDEPLCFFNGAVVSSIAMTSIVIGNIADP